MLEIEYTTNAQETANATLDFFTNRPILATLFSVMKFLCILFCIGFAISAYFLAIRPQDIITLFVGIGWLFYYKKVNNWVIAQSLKLRKFTDMHCSYKIDDKSILYRVQNFDPHHIEWKKLKFVLKNKDGYIIPLTGIANAGRFLWIPLRSLSNANAEQELLQLTENYKLKITNI